MKNASTRIIAPRKRASSDVNSDENLRPPNLEIRIAVKISRDTPETKAEDRNIGARRDECQRGRAIITPKTQAVKECARTAKGIAIAATKLLAFFPPLPVIVTRQKTRQKTMYNESAIKSKMSMDDKFG